MRVDSDDGQTPSAITSHLFTPPVGEPWACCSICSISEAAHVETGDLYDTEGLPYRCPYCVDNESDRCHHGRPNALDIDGSRLGPAQVA